ncbi:Mitomycin biosynthesis 6-O-methyltransferase [termite gut metagenome]|uniref:Mitomycin biosynthesis 6-O-methyltransferase n=1 Tax=termite gut metagenome TaxID=433724 RepID=A0A5J4S0R7_9ZZZZ
MKDELKNIFTEHWKYLTINAACKLDLFDALEIPMTAKELSEKLYLNERNLTTLLKALCSIDFLKYDDNVFSLNEKSNLLTEKHPDILKYACMNWSSEHLTAWQNLDYSIKTGKSTFEYLYQDDFFSYLNKFPAKLDDYHKAMFEYARDDYQNLPGLVDFSIHKSIMDVGGGYGAAIHAIKTKYPVIACYLFDLPKVIENAQIENINTIAGNFFENIPQLADAIILSRVLHDWDDEKATAILQNCYNTLPFNGTLYVIENCADKIDMDLSLLSLNMIAMCESYERTSQEYIDLAQKVGFEIKPEIKLNELQTTLIFVKQ